MTSKDGFWLRRLFDNLVNTYFDEGHNRRYIEIPHFHWKGRVDTVETSGYAKKFGGDNEIWCLSMGSRF